MMSIRGAGLWSYVSVGLEHSYIDEGVEVVPGKSLLSIGIG